MPLNAGGNSTVWTENLVIRSFDVDFKHSARLESLCGYFVEAAWNHAEELGVGFRHLAKEEQYWVLSRMVVEIETYPGWGGEVKLVTWARGASSIFALRDFEMFDSGGRRLLGGASAWLVLDAHTRRPQRIEKLSASIQSLPDRKALSQDPQKLPALEKVDAAVEVTARYSSIDVNNHVNSARYIGWILDSYPMEFLRQYYVRRFEVNYLGETLAEQSVSVSTRAISSNAFLHSLAKSNSQEVCRARVLWCKADETEKPRRNIA